MKKLIILILLIIGFFTNAQVGVGTTTPDANAQLDVVSTQKGMLVPRLNAGQVTTLTGTLTGINADPGMIIFNTTENCLQIFNGTTFECVVTTNDNHGIGNEGVVKINFDISSPTPLNTDPGYINLAKSGNDAPWYPFDFTGLDTTNLSGYPITNWPENAFPDTLITDIWFDDAYSSGAGSVTDGEPVPNADLDGWADNDIPGQVHLWRITVRSNPGNANGDDVEIRLRNPATGFITASNAIFPATSGESQITYAFISIAGSSTSKYVLEARSPAGNFEIWIESITRISLYHD